MSRGHPGLYGSDRPPDEQTRALHAGRVPVAVYGPEEIGLPLVAVYVRAMGDVTGINISGNVVGGVNSGECHVAKESGLPELIVGQAERGASRMTTDGVAAAEGTAVHVIVVPTPLTDGREPNLTAFEAVLDNIARGLAPDNFVVVECTVPPGTSKGLIIPHLTDRSGLSTDKFGVAFCPERASSGRVLHDVTESHPRIVGGVDTGSTHVTALIYGKITASGVILVHDATTARAVKLSKGVYRDVNIALANGFTRLHDDLGIDVTETIDAANTQLYCDIHTPDPGIDGHCIPWYPYFITNQVAAETPLLLTARKVNDSMPAFTADELHDELAAVDREIRGATVAILGVTYRPGVAETRTTPATGVIDRLSDLSATVLAVDPVLSDEVVASFGATPVSFSDLPNRAIGATVIVAPHGEFNDIDWATFDDLIVVGGCDTLGNISHRVYEISGGPRGESSKTEAGPEITADPSHGGPGRRTV